MKKFLATFLVMLFLVPCFTTKASTNEVTTFVATSSQVKLSKTEITKQELIDGFNLTIELNSGVNFDTSCYASKARASIVSTSNITIQALPYYSSISKNKIQFHIQALNDVSYLRETLEFKILSNATNLAEDLYVRIPFKVEQIPVAEIEALKALREKAWQINQYDYILLSYVPLRQAIIDADTLIAMASNNIGSVTSADIRNHMDRLTSGLDGLVKAENLHYLVHFKDYSLQEAVKKELGKTGSSSLTRGDLKGLTTLDLDGNGNFSSLIGLEYAVNLKTINLNNNKVTDFSAIKNLTNIEDLSALNNKVLNNTNISIVNNRLYEIDESIIDLDGKRMVATEIILSPDKNPVSVNVSNMYTDGKIKIDSKYINSTGLFELVYKSPYNNIEVTSRYKVANVYADEDINRDNNVDILDLASLSSAYNKTELVKNNINFDFNSDGVIDIFDITTIAKKMR